jgi:hypothetical protein
VLSHGHIVIAPRCPSTSEASSPSPTRSSLAVARRRSQNSERRTQKPRVSRANPGLPAVWCPRNEPADVDACILFGYDCTHNGYRT